MTDVLEVSDEVPLDSASHLFPTHGNAKEVEEKQQDQRVVVLVRSRCNNLAVIDVRERVERMLPASQVVPEPYRDTEDPGPPIARRSDSI